MDELDNFFVKINIVPNNLAIYKTAFTHSSFNFDANTTHRDYERLEFMGDSLIGFVVADLAFNLHSDLSQGDMSKLRSTLVQSQGLKELAMKYEMEKYVIVGKSLLNQDLSKMSHLLEDVFEAVIGAIYLDQGLKKAYGVVKGIFYDKVKDFDFTTLHDYKSRLQEEFQAETRQSVEYIVLKESGPAHDRVFKVAVKFGDIVLGTGEARSKKDAEQAAAKDALSKKA
ncbi:MAG: ribonuclease III [Bacilli bacterium]